MTDSFKRIAPDTLRIERVLDAPVDTVWRWLVDPALRRQWFAGGTASEHEGEFDMVFDHDELSVDPVPYPERYAKFKGARSRERVLRSEPPRLLVWTWDEGKEGTVTFELIPQGYRTLLVLTHAGISGPAGFKDFGSGWVSHLAVLQGRLNGSPVRDFWTLHARTQADLERELAD